MSHPHFPSPSPTESLACHLTSPELAKRKRTVVARLKKQVLESKETAHGFTYKFNGSDEIIDQLSEFIKMERACCPFFIFTLTTARASEAVWLELSGPEGSKEFIKTVLEF